jgi:formate-dependent phosphoribosylglycinamide formyltransferase (GAR transformylase)
VDFALINGDGEAAKNLCIAFHRLGVEVVNPEQFGHGLKCIQGFGN